MSLLAILKISSPVRFLSSTPLLSYLWILLPAIHVFLASLSFRSLYTPVNNIFTAQITSAVRTKPELAWASGDIRDYVIEAASSVLGADFEFNVPIVIDDSEPTGLTIYDALTNVCLPRCRCQNFRTNSSPCSCFLSDRLSLSSSGKNSGSLLPLCWRQQGTRYLLK